MNPSDVKLRELFDADFKKYIAQWSDSEMPITGEEQHAYKAGYEDCAASLSHLLEMAAGALKFYADCDLCNRVVIPNVGEPYTERDDGMRAKQTLLTLQQHGFGKD